MQFDGHNVAYLAGAQVVGRAHLGKGGHDGKYPVLRLLGQGLLDKFVDAWFDELEGDLEDEEAYHYGCQGIEDGPLVAKQHGATYAHKRANGGECIAAVMPGVGYDGLGVVSLAHNTGDVVEQFLQHYARQCCPQGNDARRIELIATQYSRYGRSAIVEQAHANQKQDKTYDGCGQSLVLAVTIVVVAVLWAGGDAHEGNYDDVGDEVSKRVCGICHHSSTVANDACHKLEDEQRQVDNTSPDGDGAYLAFSLDTVFHWHNR